MKRIIILFLFLLELFLIPLPAASQKRAITIEDLWSILRIEDFVLSPDGEWIAYSITQFDMNQNKGNIDIYLISSMGGTAHQLTTHPADDKKPFWSPDGSLLAFISDREGTPQIYVLPMNGGEPQKISDITTGVKDFIWSPDGKYIAFTSDVHTSIIKSDSIKESNYSAEKENIQAKIIDKLLYRHWNRWIQGKRSHLFVMPSIGGPAWDVTPGDFDTPPISLGSKKDFTFSPDGKQIAFVRNTDPEVALSTNNDIFIVPSTGGTIRRITQNPANDNQPVYSADGKYIAYRAMRRSGFEADQYDLMLYNRKTGYIKNLTIDFDLSVKEIIWSPSNEKIYFNAHNQGRITIFSIDIKSSKIKGLIHTGCNTNIDVPPEENQLFYLRTNINMPKEIFSCDEKGENVFQLTFTNKNLLSQLEMNSLEDFWFTSFDNKNVHGILLKPPFFDPVKKYPSIMLIHGGPQNSWDDEFHYRWNAQTFAACGYIIIMINIRGSRGYGQDFCDAVSRDWGGGPYRDLMAGLDYVIKKYAFIDPEKIASAGASYGGYMVNWIAGNTNRFKCLISHDSVSDLFSFYGTTEELWFPEWEFNGSPYENSKLYEKWSPLRYAKNFTTPMLIIQGEKDFRTPVNQGLQMFTALQRRNVPSKLLYFPDEGHYVLKPQNARLWWKTVLDWIKKWIDIE